jgi:hypothetical protein
VADRTVQSPDEPDDANALEGLITLRKWSALQGRSHGYVRLEWRKREGFPEPVSSLPARGRHGGGRGEQLFEQSALDAWRSAHPELDPPERIDLSALEVGAEDRMTLGRFAGVIGKDRKTVTQHRGREGFPEPGEDGLYRAGDLAGYWNARTGRRGRGKRARNPLM